MILKLSKDKKLTFYRKNPIYIGEKDFDTIEVLIPFIVDNNETNNLNFILHLVNKNGEYLHINLDKEIKEDIVVGSTKISSTITNEAQNFFLYLELIKENNEIIGKTNCVEITIEPLPDEDTRIIPKEEYEEIIDELTEIIQENTEAMNRINEFEDGKSAYEIAVEHGYEGTEEDWLQSLNGKEGKSAYEIAVEQGYEGTEEEWLSEMRDYSELNNKPQINGHTLSGNKTSDDLGLQKKLTAGQNITIESDGTISADGGGVTSYNDLTDKPQIYAPVYNSSNELVGNENITIEDIINMTYGFCVRIDSQENKSLEPYNIYNHSLHSDKDLLVGRSISYYGKYDFDELSYDLRCAGMWETQASQCKHVPAFISDLFVSGSRNYLFFITHYHSHVGAAGGAPMIRSVAGKDKNGDFRIYYQYIRLSDNNDGTISNQSDWVELTGGGAQIVSGAVNQNGTITFTDSDGNTFTTTGSSVIGADGFSPVATVTPTASGATVSITDKNGTTTANISNGAPGQDYVLTSQDKSDIADIVLGELPTTEGVLYGNTNN